MTLNETKSISNVAYVLSRVSNVIDKPQLQKRKRNKGGYDYTRSVFYIRWDTGM